MKLLFLLFISGLNHHTALAPLAFTAEVTRTVQLFRSWKQKGSDLDQILAALSVRELFSSSSMVSESLL